MHQDDALAELVELADQGLGEFVGLLDLEIPGIDVGGEARDVPLAQVSEHLGRMTQVRETEERRDRGARHHAYRACALFDFVLGGFRAAFFHRRLQVCMRPGVAADGVAGREHLLQDFRVIGGVLADRKEGRPEALVGKRLEHRLGVVEPGAVVEGEHDLVVAQEIVVLEVLGAEARPSSGVDLDHAGNAHGIWIVAGDGRLCGGGGCRGWGRRALG